VRHSYHTLDAFDAEPPFLLFIEHAYSCAAPGCIAKTICIRHVGWIAQSPVAETDTIRERMTVQERIHIMDCVHSK